MIAHDTRSFEILSCLGRGGFGEVYRARMHRGSFSVDVAVKLLRSDIDPNGHAAGRLRDEARLMGRVRHRALPRVYDLLELDGRLALVSELLDGADLDDCLRMTPPMGLGAVLEALAEVAAALHAAWSTPAAGGQPLGLVHRDLKPANLRITPDGGVRVLDLGIAWAAGLDRSAETQTGALIGSPAYMAPERFLGDVPASPGDVYSLGCVLFEAIAGRRLWAETGFPVLAALAVDQARFESALHARLALPVGLPPGLARSLTSTLAWRPADRPDVATLAADWARFAAAAGGPSLAAWCATAPWSELPAESGGLVGSVLRESAGRPTREATVPAPMQAPRANLPPRHLEVDTRDVEPLDSGFLTPADPLKVAPPLLSPEAPTPVQPPPATPASPAEPASPVAPTSPAPVRPAPAVRVATADLATPPPTTLTRPPDRRLAAAVLGLAGAVWLGWTLRPADPAPSEIVAAPALAAAPAPAVSAPAAEAPAPPAGAPLSAPPPTAADAPRAAGSPPPAAATASRAPTVADAARPARVGPTTPAAIVAAPTAAAVPEPAPEAPTAPATAADPPPAADPPADTVRVALDPASQSLNPYLMGGGKRWSVPGAVPPGTYQIFAEKIPGHPQVLGTTTLTGGAVTLRCVHGLCAAR